MAGWEPTADGALPRRVRSVWSSVWEDVVAREAIARDLRRAKLDPSFGGPLETRCRLALLPRARAEIDALLAMPRREVAWASRVVLGLVLVLMGVTVLDVQAAVPRLLRGDAHSNDVVAVLAMTSLIFTTWLTVTRSTGTVPVANATARLRRTLEMLLVPYLRRTVNEALRVPYDTLDVREATGLTETVDPSLEVPTAARGELTALLSRMGSGAIGLAGARGAGKSTLIRAACGGRLTPPGWPPTIGVALAAPVRWEASEFVPLLYAELCKRVAPWAAEPSGRMRRPVRDLLVGYAGLFGALLLAFLATKVLLHQASIHGEDVEAFALALGALALLLVTWGPIQRQWIPVVMQSGLSRRRRALVSFAEQSLRELRYRETIVNGWSMEGSGLLGVRLARRHELSATEQPLTLPEVVARYKAFVRAVAEQHTLVVGIDELDKMDSAEEAARFLRDVKVLFGEQPCIYLVSVSDDAMSEFERRGVPLRTVFDSTFDDVLHVETLSFAEARAIVNGRVVGMGDGHIAVCHMLGDGIPRELIRYVRGAVEASTRDVRTPGEVACALVADRQRRLERAASAVAERHLDPCADAHPLLDWLHALPDPVPASLPLRWDVAATYAAVGVHAASAKEREQQRALLLELAAVAYRAATVVALAQSLDADMLAALTRAREPSPALTLLAQAGRDLGRGPRAAWRTVDRARDEMELPRIPFPLRDEKQAARDGDHDAFTRRLRDTLALLR